MPGAAGFSEEALHRHDDAGGLPEIGQVQGGAQSRPATAQHQHIGFQRLPGNLAHARSFIGNLFMGVVVAARAVCYGLRLIAYRLRRAGPRRPSTILSVNR